MRRLVVLLTGLASLTTIGEAGLVRRDLASEGNAYYMVGDFQSAASAYNRVREENPLSAGLAFNLGTARAHQNDLAAAREEFQQATRADDNQLAAEAYHNLALLEYQNAREQMQASQQDPEAGPQAQQDYMASLGKVSDLLIEGLKKQPNDKPLKHNLEMVLNELAFLEQQQQQQDQQQNQEQQEDKQDDSKEDQSQSEQQEQQEQDQEQQESQDQGEGQNQESETGNQPTPAATGTPAQTPTPGMEEVQAEPEETETVTEGQQQAAEAGDQQEATQELDISAEYARNLLENLPERRNRIRPPQNRQVEKDW